jgi:hypothetical protein
MNIKVETWRKAEICLTASKEYDNPVRNVILDMEITNGNKALVVPGFWNGKRDWCIRFALPEEGIWNFKTICKQDEALNGLTGTVECTKYSGDLEIFKRGFVTTAPDKQYFIYADGTPFFYLGDTHWNFMAEEFDSPGDHACDIKCESHFKYIVDRRKKEGYTVYQTEPLETGYDLTDGIDDKDIESLKKADKYYEYIADQGLVHANAQFFFPSDMIKLMQNDPDYLTLLEDLSRYWVARFSAFPCLWTLGQEIDNDFYYLENQKTNQTMNAENNPYKNVCEWLYKYDPLKQPISGHQEGSYFIGKFTTAANSAFRNVTGHTWWANQWKPVLNTPLDFTAAIDFWFNGQNKPSIVYEARYELLWTNSFGARIQGWIAILNGMFGHGYGAVDMWLYKSTYDIKNPTFRDGISMSVEGKLLPWGKTIDLPGGIQMTYMKQFFEKLEWWRLEPCFDLNEYFTGDHGYYSAAHIGNDTYVAYFYDKLDDVTTDITGTFKRLDDNASYTYRWFDPRTNEYSSEMPASVKNNEFKIPARPTKEDWVILLTSKR